MSEKHVVYVRLTLPQHRALERMLDNSADCDDTMRALFGTERDLKVAERAVEAVRWATSPAMIRTGRVRLDRTLEMLEYLTSDEGDAVDVLSSNPDANGIDQQYAVDCYGDWLGYIDRRFYGDTCGAAIEAAFLARREAEANG